MRGMMSKLRRAVRRGQGMTEYIIIVAVIAVLSIAVVTKFGDQIRNLFKVSGEEMAGADTEGVQNKMDGVTDDRTLSDIGK